MPIEIPDFKFDVAGTVLDALLTIDRALEKIDKLHADASTRAVNDSSSSFWRTDLRCYRWHQSSQAQEHVPRSQAKQHERS